MTAVEAGLGGGVVPREAPVRCFFFPIACTSTVPCSLLLLSSSFQPLSPVSQMAEGSPKCGWHDRGAPCEYDFGGLSLWEDETGEGREGGRGENAKRGKLGQAGCLQYRGALIRGGEGGEG